MSMDQHRGLSRREALIRGAALYVSTTASTIPSPRSASVKDLVERATRRRRVLRNGVPPPVNPEIDSANLPLNSYEAVLQTAAQSAALAAEAKKLGRQALRDDDRETLECLIWDLERDAGYAQFYWHEFPLGYFGSELNILTLQLPTPPATGEADRFLQKVRQAPAYVDGIRERLDGQLQRRLTAPRAEGVRAYDQFTIEAKEVAATIHANADALAAQPGGGSAAREARLVTAGPLAEALARLGDTIRSDYVPALGEQAKIARAADAPEYFRELARLRISDDLGLAETYQHARDRRIETR